MVLNGDQQVKDNKQPATFLSQLIKLVLFVALTGVSFYGVLSLVQPQYKSVAQLLLEPVSIDGKAGRGGDKLVATQMKALTSRSLLTGFIEKQKLADDPEYNAVLSRHGPLQRVLTMTGLVADPAKLPKDKRVLQAFGAKINFERGHVPNTMKISVRSSHPDKSARLANDYANAYIARLGAQRSVQTPTTVRNSQDALMVLLRSRIAAHEAELTILREDLRINPFVEAGTLDQHQVASPSTGAAVPEIKLSKEQLFELTSQYILAKAGREEAELRVKLVRDMVETTGNIHSTSSVLNTGLIQKLLIRSSRMERKLADLSVTLLPSHPQMKRLNREMASLRTQVSSEAEKVVVDLENEVKIAMVRETSIKESLERLKAIPIRELAQNNAAGNMEPASFDNRQARQEELQRSIADDRTQLTAVQARQSAQALKIKSASPWVKASLIKKAVAMSKPVFPNKKPITLLGMLIALCLGLIMLVMGKKSGQNNQHKVGRPMPRPQDTATKTDRNRAGRHTPVGFGAKPVQT